MRTTPQCRLWQIACVVGILNFTALAAPPIVKTVPWVSSNPLIPHSTYSGKTVTLKGTCDQGGADLQWTWDFGDGSPVVTGSVSDRYAIQASHAYTGPVGKVFTARLTVQNTISGETGTKTYFIVMMDQTLEAEVNIAIDEGLWALHIAQSRYESGGVNVGDWQTWHWAYGVTAANVNAFEVNGHLETGDPANPYTETVQRGMRYVLQVLTTRQIGLQALGNPDANGNGYGVCLNQSYQYYQGGMFMDALVASGTPNAIATTGQVSSGGNPGILGRTYKDIVQDMVDDHAWAQYDDGNYGGWRYSAQDFPDNSACQWAVIGLLAAERSWGCTIPDWVKTANVNWLARTQHPVGYFGYTDWNPVWGPFATTPSGMVQMVMDGIGRGMTGPAGSPAWDSAETYIRDNFGNTGGPGNAIKEYYYGMFSFVKSMLLYPYDGDENPSTPDPTPIALLRSQTAGMSPLDWYAAEVSKGAPTDGVARTLVDQQNPAGWWWYHDYSGDQHAFETAWAIMMLHRTLFESGVPVAVPKSVPNPGIVGQSITLDGSDAYHQDSGRNIVSWAWDLDSDGVIDATGPFATATFNAVGSYPVKLLVTDDNVPAKTVESTIMVLITTPPIAPTADADGPYIFCPSMTKWFLDGRRSVNPDEGRSEPHSPPYPGDTIQDYAWDLDGDNQYDDAFGPTPDVTAYFQAAGPGDYLIGLRVTDTTDTSYPSSGLGNLVSTATAQVLVRNAGDLECQPLTLTATPGLKQITLTWTPYPTAHHFNVYRSTVSGGPYTWVQSVVSGPYSEDPGILNQVYYYVVRPAAANGDELGQSNEASAEPLHPGPTVACTPKVISNLAKYYYELTAASQSFGRMQLKVFIGDTMSAQVAGPFSSTKIVYIRTGLASPSTRPGSGSVAGYIMTKGKARVWAEDPIGQKSAELLVP